MDIFTSAGVSYYLILPVNVVNVYNFNAEDVSSISLTPIGFGVNTLVEVYYNNGWQTVVNDVLYQKATYPVGYTAVSSVRITISNSNQTFPKLIGIGDLTLFTSNKQKQAQLYSVELQPTNAFSSVQLNYQSTIPSNTSINSFVSIDNINWLPVTNGSWVNVTSTNTPYVSDIGSTNWLTSSNSLNNLYEYLVGSASVSTTNGQMSFGINQFEVSATRQSSFGQFPYVPSLGDFNNGNILTTWCTPQSISTGTSELIQPYGTDYSQTLYNLNSTQSLVRYRTVDSLNQPYGQLDIVPTLSTPGNNPLQFGFIYKFECNLYCLQAQTVDIGKYWFYQGYRSRTSGVTFRQLNKSYCSFNLYVNGNQVVGDSQPYTVWDTADTSGSYIETGGENGVGFTFGLNQGWNTFTIVVCSTDPNIYYNTDNNTLGNPYLQLSLYPNIFSNLFSTNYNISYINGSKNQTPLDMFDLTWNTTPSLKVWGWNPFDLRYVVFNQKNLVAIDNYYLGELPNHSLQYTSLYNSVPSNLWARFDYLSDSQLLTSPILNGYSLNVQ